MVPVVPCVCDIWGYKSGEFEVLCFTEGDAVLSSKLNGILREMRCLTQQDWELWDIISNVCNSPKYNAVEDSSL